LVHELDHHNKFILVAGPHPEVEAMLEKSKWYTEKRDIGLVFPSHKEALQWLEDRDRKLQTKEVKITTQLSKFPDEEGYYELTDSTPTTPTFKRPNDPNIV